MSETIALSEVDQTLADLLRPTIELDARLAAEEEQLKSKLKELREQRTKMKVVLRTLDPENYGPKPKVQKNDKGVSPEVLADLERFLRNHAGEMNGGFTATSLVRDLPRWEGGSQSTAAKALAILHDRGVVRLDRRGTGGSKIFKVVQ